MKLYWCLGLVFIFEVYFAAGQCPSHCRDGEVCDVADSGCSNCELGYYGRTCQHRTECRYTTKGEEYRGKRNTTKNGKTCQRWDSQSPHSHPMQGEENYCRNPDGEPEPWCYTTDPDTRWNYCDVKMCSTQCTTPALYVSYLDIMNPPSDGFVLGFNATLSCSVGDVHAVYTVCNSNRTWTFVNFPNCRGECPGYCKAGQLCKVTDSGCSECAQAYYGRECQHRMECRYTTKGKDYRGKRNTTRKGKTCQRWDSQSPHPHTWQGEENYCRNPDGEPEPWCYTTDPNTRWDFCDVKMCNTQCLSPALDVPYLDIMNPPSDGFAIGFKATLGCIVGAVNRIYTTCQKDKTWSPVNLPNCTKNEAVKCVDLYPTSNLLKWNPKKREFYYKDKVTFECKGGYKLSHSNSLECQADKMWDNEIKSCIEVCDGLTTAQWIGITSGFIVITAIVTAIVSVIATYRILHKKTTKDTIPSNLVNNEAFNYEAIDVSMRVVEEPHVYNIPQERSFTNIQDDNGQNYQNN